MRTADFDYALPPERIAQEPLAERDASRLLLIRENGDLEDRWFIELPELLRPGDLLVANETRVRNARLHGIDGDGREVELLVLERRNEGSYLCLAGPARVATPGAVIRIGDHLEATVIGPSGAHPGGRWVTFDAEDADAAIEAAGDAPLPPYIHETLADPSRYQTLYATGAPDSAAAPTAGLHFTARVLERLRERGVGWATVRLEVGLGTFAPIRTESVEDHEMHEEQYSLPAATVEAIAATRGSGGRVIAVGTTVVRVLETCAGDNGGPHAGTGRTRLFIRPGHRFRAVDGLLTNFHQPLSSLLVLLDAFAGAERRRAAYAHALRGDYRFLSLGDCMLCWRA
ncbi:MAG TPA: tRNA preQ1(34) S-adenosylmethionine ribosyltransferase-isomerase QueA [Candidatus Acidoferrales bacterium]|nr:tRNA preQ1(34) S-adenosylmethionine ribosyltransferase-isomerase QueA [Candidatus Acidoferrales bacterium]